MASAQLWRESQLCVCMRTFPTLCGGYHGFAERAFGLQVNYDGEVLMDEYVKVPEKAPLSSRGARYSTVRVSAAHQHSARAGHRLSDECERN